MKTAREMFRAAIEVNKWKFNDSRWEIENVFSWWFMAKEIIKLTQLIAPSYLTKFKRTFRLKNVAGNRALRSVCLYFTLGLLKLTLFQDRQMANERNDDRKSQKSR